MNSKPEAVEVIRELEARFDLLDINYVQYHEVAVDMDESNLHEALSFLKSSNFRQLSALTCVDWPSENKFQLIFNVFDWTRGVRIILRVKIDREGARFTTATGIYNGAKYYEREVHEFSG